MITKTDFDAKLSSLNRKVTQSKSKHLLVENELTTLENKVPDVSSLVKKTDYNTKVAEIDTMVSSLDGKIAENKTKSESIQNELKGLKKILVLLFWEIYSLMEEMVLKLI